MKPCHICERIIRTDKSIICQACTKAYCNPCISKHFPEKALLLNSESSIPTLRFSQCFACLDQCKCHKCKTSQNVVIITTGKNNPSHNAFSSIVDDVAESGLFKGRKVSELPLHLQRIYIKKKVLYSKHEISCTSNDKNIPQQQNNDQLEERALPPEERERKDDESPNNNTPKPEGGSNQAQKNQNDDQEQQAEDYESEFPSRRAAHLHDRNDQSAINDADVEDEMEVQGQDPNNEAPQRPDSAVEENGESARGRAQGTNEEGQVVRNNDSSVEPAGQ